MWNFIRVQAWALRRYRSNLFHLVQDYSARMFSLQQTCTHVVYYLHYMSRAMNTEYLTTEFSFKKHQCGNSDKKFKVLNMQRKDHLSCLSRVFQKRYSVTVTVEKCFRFTLLSWDNVFREIETIDSTVSDGLLVYFFFPSSPSTLPRFC